MTRFWWPTLQRVAKADVSLRLRLLVFVGLPVVLTFVVLITIETVALRRSASANAMERARLLAQQTAQLLDSELSTAAGAADTLADALSLGGVTWSSSPILSSELVERLQLVVGIAVAFDIGHAPPEVQQAGYVYLHDGKIKMADIAAKFDITKNTPWYLPNLKPGPGQWTDPFYGEVVGKEIVSYTTRFISEDGVKGWVVVDIGMTELFKQLDVNGFEDVIPSLTTADGDKIKTPLPEGAHDPGEDHIEKSAKLPTLGWTFDVEIGAHEVFASVDRQLLFNGLLLSVGAIIVLAILLRAGLRMAGRIRQLSTGVSQVSGGDLGATVPDLGTDEVGALAAGFNAMTSRLRETLDQIAEEAGRRQAIERELQVAREIQQSMLPTETEPFHDRAEFDLHAVLQPADQVAGDFYDWWMQGDTLTVVVADVSGHGIGPALVMAMARRVLRDAAAKGVDIDELASSVDQSLAENNPRQMFITAIMLQLDVQTGVYRIVNAGHPRAMLVDADGARAEGDPTGPLLGIMPDGQWSIREGVLDPGASIVIYTDGITEAMDAQGEMLGQEGLEKGLEQDTASDLCANTIGLAKSHQDGVLADDLTVVALRWLGPLGSEMRPPVPTKEEQE
ncbi:MAG: SpoIIE family protein phosphatase [Phycisphaerales bacterium]|nr:SpoIIE family protein phosphatase [Phycisphaerales bacterium]